MKKIVCFVIALVLLTTTAFAATADSVLSAFEKTQNLKSAEFTMDVSTKLNQPLKFLSTIPKDGYTDVDYAMLLENLVDATLHLEGAFLMTEDKQKMDMAVTSAFNVPISFNKNFRLDAWAQIGAWVQYDITNPENPVYRTITETPFSNQYQVVDIPDADAFAKVLTDGKQEAFLKESLDLLKETASFGWKNGFYTISFTDETLRQYLLKLLPSYREFIVDTTPEIDDFCSGMERFLENCTLLGSGGMNLLVKVSQDGFISIENSEIHIKLNLYDILKTFDKITNGLEREDAWIDMTLTLEEKLSRHNKVKEISIPEVYDENAYFSGNSGSYYFLHEPPVFAQDSIYYPMDKIAKHYGFSVEKKDGMLAIATPDGENVVAFLADSNTLFVDGIQIPTEVVPAMLQDGKLYCSQEVFDLLGISISVSADSTKENSFQIRSYYYDFSAYEEETAPDEEFSYEPQEYYFSFYHKQMPPVIDGQCYMPIYEFLQELAFGEFSYGDGMLSFAANGENPLNIREVSAWVGDPHIYWNGEGLPLGGKVVEQNGIMYIPVGFTNQLQLHGRANINFYDGTVHVSYHMELENPNYTEKYVPKYLYYYVFSDQTIYVENEWLYMPAYDFLQCLSKGTFTFEGERMNYTATEENSFGIQTISVCPGDEFVTVNGEAFSLDAPVVVVNQVMRIPVSFAEKLGLELDSIFVNDGSTSFDFSKKNPEYQEEENRFWYDLF